MAEFCFECMNRARGNSCSKKDYIISRELTICEGCGNLKQVVIGKKKRYPVPEGMHTYASIVILTELVRLVFKIVSLPFYPIGYLIDYCDERYRKKRNAQTKNHK